MKFAHVVTAMAMAFAGALAATPAYAQSPVSEPAAEMAPVDCKEEIRQTWGRVTCTASRGPVTIKSVRFDCDWELDLIIENQVIKGTWSKTHECDHKILGIDVTI
ncbi:hypothetical protein [Pilimelia columellifera]|uniref:Uncharacterized protein n=1 Tax=Pilimelia columellifera subsp. columellifera TaxID=706583 RepID=A0ABN3NVC9_9ACTN